RNDAFNANSYFNNKNGLPRDILKRHQFGVTVGGPVVIPHVIDGHNKLFFFSAYQGQRLTATTTTSQFGVYTTHELKGGFSISGTGGILDPNVVAFLNNHAPYQPNAALRAQAIIDPTKIDPVTQKYIAGGLVPSSTTGQMISRGLSKQDSDELINKVDFDITSNDKLQATITTGRAPTLTPFSGGSLSPLFPINGSANRYFGSLSYTKIFSPNLLNVARFTAQRIRTTQAFPASKLPTAADLGIGITPDESTGPPRIFLAGAFTLGFSPQGPTTIINNTFDYSDTLSWTHGKHTSKFGFSFVPYQNNTDFDFFIDGEFDFDGAGAGFSNNSKADFLFGLPDAFTQFGKAPSNIRSKSYYVFGQDEWKITRNLVLTFGLRYEYSSPKLDTQGRSFSLLLGANSTVFSNAPT